ncbi:MAG TPA: ATP-binding cassette domain-containing protein [Burkholderiales bacterium]|nr:ATP-binding cassette domain-containing protein [Burkholderiales bacterium]
MSTGLEVQGLTVRYGKALALDNVSFTAQAGAITAMVGPNGAGKSSCLNAIYGGVASSGALLLDGQDLSKLTPMQRARHGVALVPQGRQLFMRMSVRENLEVMARLLGLGEAEIEAGLDRFPVLRQRARQYAGVLSGGEQQMLAVSRALMGKPRLLLLDEMVTGLAPLIVRELVATAVRMAAEGVTVIVAEPSVGAVRSHITHGLVMLRGRIVAEEAGGDALEAAYQKHMGMAA